MGFVEALTAEREKITGIPALRLVFGLGYLGAVTGFIYILFSNWGYDDPFITYRYADNLIRGLGFVYNPGERILSTTTPFFTLSLAASGRIWPDLPRLANFLGALSLALGALFLWDLSRSWQSPLVGWAALLLYPSFPLLLTTLGSEMPLYIALCLGSYAFYARQQYTQTALLAALGVLTRPDGILVPALLALHFLVRVRTPIPWRAIALFLGISISWFAFAWFYFGSPLPATLFTKQQQAVMAISQGFAQGFITTFRGYLNWWQYRLETILIGVGVIFTLFRSRKWLLFLAWLAIYFLAYTLLGVSRYFWYYAPLVSGFVVLIGLGITGLVALAARLVPSIPAWRLSLGLVALLLLPLTFAQVRGVLRYPQLPSRLGIYRAVGEWLHANLPPEASVGTLEVGIIGYYARRPMVDFAGLIQPDVAGHLSRDITYDESALWAVGRYQPEYLVLHAGYFPNLESNYVAGSCEELATFQGSAYDYETDMRVFSCR